MTSKENLPVTGLRLQGSDLPKMTQVGAELGADSDLLPWAGARPSRRSAAPARPPRPPAPPRPKADAAQLPRGCSP